MAAADPSRSPRPSTPPSASCRWKIRLGALKRCAKPSCVKGVFVCVCVRVCLCVRACVCVCVFLSVSPLAHEWGHGVPLPPLLGRFPGHMEMTTSKHSRALWEHLASWIIEQGIPAREQQRRGRVMKEQS